MATLGKIRFETRGKMNPAQWKVFLGNHDISHLVAGMSITVAANMPLPVVNLTLIGQVELPPELTAILQATQLPAATENGAPTSEDENAPKIALSTDNQFFVETSGIGVTPV